MFLDCPAYLDHERTVRCGLPAEVRYRFTMRSTDGPLESAMIRCPAGHCFSGPIESLTWHGKDKRDPGSAAVTPRAGRDSVQGSHDGRDGVGWTAVRDFPAEPELEISRPNTAPAYYGLPDAPMSVKGFVWHFLVSFLSSENDGERGSLLVADKTGKVHSGEGKLL